MTSSRLRTPARAGRGLGLGDTPPGRVPPRAAEPPSAVGRASLTLNCWPGKTKPEKSRLAVIFLARAVNAASSVNCGAGGKAEIFFERGGAFAPGAPGPASAGR